MHQACQLQPLGLRPARHDPEHLVHDARQVEIDDLQLQSARLDLGKVEDIVDDRQQRLARLGHGLGKLALFVVQLGVEQEAGHADDAVHRGADLVAHIGEKLTLRQIRRLGRLGQTVGAPHGLLKIPVRHCQLFLGAAQVGLRAAALRHLLFQLPCPNRHPRLERVACRLQGPIPILDLFQHLVELFGQRSQLVARGGHHTQRVVFLQRHLPGGLGEMVNRPRDQALQPGRQEQGDKARQRQREPAEGPLTPQARAHFGQIGFDKDRADPFGIVHDGPEQSQTTARERGTVHARACGWLRAIRPVAQVTREKGPVATVQGRAGHRGLGPQRRQDLLDRLSVAERERGGTVRGDDMGKRYEFAPRRCALGRHFVHQDRQISQEESDADRDHDDQDQLRPNRARTLEHGPKVSSQHANFREPPPRPGSSS